MPNHDAGARSSPLSTSSPVTSVATSPEAIRGSRDDFWSSSPSTRRAALARVVASSGVGARLRPSSSRTTAVSTSEAPKPSYSSGTASAATPTCSQSACHSASSYPASDSMAARTAALSLRLSSSDATIEASSSCSSVRAKCISGALRERVRDAAPVVRRGAPRPDQRAHPVDPEAEVELGGVADRAVHLEGHPRGEVRRVAGRHLRARHVARLQRQRRSVHQRTREVERDPYVGQLVLDRLVGADGAAVLLALLHVLHRVGQQPLATTEQLGGSRRARPGRSRRRRTSCGVVHLEQSPGGVDRA